METAIRQVAERRVPVWDPLVRLLHWSLVAGFAAAYVSQDPQWLHDWAGYGVLAAVAVRLVWGLIGPGHARFADFVKGPAATLRYLTAILRGHPKRFLGHNPAGGAMIVALLLGVAATAGSGWLMITDRFWGNALIEDIHELAAHLTVGLIGLHVLGVIIASLQHRENLAAAMVTGYKRHEAEADEDRPESVSLATVPAGD